MTGPEHYQRAADMAARVADRLTEIGHASTRETLALAQVHATLALAAATALNDGGGGMATADYQAWTEAASGMPS